ncbi:MAG TPA: hypothetical protein VKH37_08610, partial [Ferruginibacter sp.]|nr:hypothetical protein [Ferruginibacter sp.]
DSTVSFRFLLTTGSHIIELRKVAGNVRQEQIVKDALMSYAAMWKPAMQNGRDVCAYMTLDMQLVNDKIKLTIRQ